MSLFTDTEPEAPESPPRGRRAGRVILFLAAIGVIGAAVAPAPYVIEQPGPVFNTLGTSVVKGSKEPLISIPAEKTYPTAGTLDMLTVNISGNPEQPPSWAEIVTAWLDPSKAIVPIDEIYPQGETIQQSNQQGQQDMVNSQQDAIAAALRSLGYSFPSTFTVASTVKGDPAYGVLSKGDVIESVNGRTFTDVPALRAEIARSGTSTPATIVYKRGSATTTVKLTPVMSTQKPSAPVIGVTLSASYRFPIQVKIQLDNVGGPSAGMMFALGIIDKLTPGELNGGKAVAGTGTIDASGVVGPIGGIRQKMYGARNAGARYFLAPKSNCDEVVGHVPSGLTVFAVARLSDSLAALKAIASGTGLASLPSCGS